MSFLSGVGNFLFGSKGGIPKNVMKLLMGELKRETGEPDVASIRGIIEPGFNRARANLGSQYANSDAPIAAGGRTQAEIGLTGEEAQAITGATLEEKNRARQRRLALLGLLATPEPGSQGLVPGLAGGAGAYFGARAGAK